MQSLGAPRYDRRWIMKLAHEKRRAARGAKPFALCLRQAWEAARAVADIAERRNPPRRDLFPVPFALAFPRLAGGPRDGDTSDRRLASPVIATLTSAQRRGRGAGLIELA